MSPSRALCAALSLSLAVVACGEHRPKSIMDPVVEVPSDLAFRFPDATDEMLIHTEVGGGTSADTPAAVLSEQDDPEEVTPDYDAVAKIVSASTRVGFNPGYAYSAARQRYTGNHGEIETAATVTYAGRIIGIQPASRENTVPYLLDFGNEKTIWVDAYVFTDQQCGLEVDGSSFHSASWQWFLGTVANWGEDSETTQAFPPVAQDSCEEEVFIDEGTGSAGPEGDGLVTCWYLVTYDLNTGEVIDAEFLYCDGSLEGG